MVPSLTPATAEMSLGVLGWPMRCDAMYIHAAAIDRGDRPAREPTLSVFVAISCAILEMANLRSS